MITGCQLQNVTAGRSLNARATVGRRVVDLDYPPFLIDRVEHEVPPRPQAPQIRRPGGERLRQHGLPAGWPTTPQRQQHRCAGDNMMSGCLNDGAGSGIPFRLTRQQAALVSAVAAEIYVCENPAAPALN